MPDSLVLLAADGREIQRVPMDEVRLKGGVGCFYLGLPPAPSSGTATHCRVDYADGSSSETRPAYEIFVLLLQGRLGRAH